MLRWTSEGLEQDDWYVKLSDAVRACRLSMGPQQQQEAEEAAMADICLGGHVSRRDFSPAGGVEVSSGGVSGRSQRLDLGVCIPLTNFSEPKHTPQSTSMRPCRLYHYRRACLSLKRNHIKTASWTCLAGTTTMKYTSIKQSLMAGCHRRWPSEDRKAFSGWISVSSTQKFANITVSNHYTYVDSYHTYSTLPVFFFYFFF